DRHDSVAAFARALRAAASRANTTLVAASVPGAVWAGLAVDGSGATTTCAAPSSPGVKPTPTPGTPAQDDLLARRAMLHAPAKQRIRNGGTRPRLAPGIAVLMLVLAAGVACIGLRPPLDVSHAFSSLSTAAKTHRDPGSKSGA